MNTPKTDIKQSKGQKRFANLSLDEPDPDFDQGNQAHQVPKSQTKIEIQRQSIFIVSRGILNQQYACLKKVPLYHTNSSYF